MDIFERIMQNEYNIHDKLDRHEAYTSFLTLGMMIGGFLMFVAITLYGILMNLKGWI